MFTVNDDELKISVRHLVEFIVREGDIDASKVSGASSAKFMLEGARIHRAIQKSSGSRYHAEVPLKMTIDEDFYRITIEGRADGIICDLEEDADGNKTPLSDVLVDEIKTIRTNLNKMTDAVPVHKAQALLYAYIYLIQKDLEKIGIRITYCNPEMENKTRYFNYEYSKKDICDWFEEIYGLFKPWADYAISSKARMEKSVLELDFPYPYREGQKKLVAGVYRCIENGDNLYIQAPTGTGKTLSTFYPAVQAMGRGLAEKIFYLTSKTITRTVAEDSFNLMQQKGLNMSCLTITARDKICFLDQRLCNPNDCIYAKGHYDRVNSCMYDLLINNDFIKRETIEDYAKKYCVCPYELSLDVSYWCQAIICDYNYVFDPDVALQRYFSDGSDHDYVVLVDEAHNLVDRARTMYSADITKEELLQLRRVKSIRNHKKIYSLIEKCNKDMLSLRKSCDGMTVYENIEAIGKLPDYLDRLYGAISDYLTDNKKIEDREEILDYFFRIRHFLEMYDRCDEKYIVYSELDKDGIFRLHLFCADPSSNIVHVISKVRSGVFFSATLLPINYFKEMITGDIGEYAIYANSVFDPDKRLLAIATDVSSRYTRRNEAEYRKICEYIEKTVASKRGNYIVFFPSYKYMKEVSDIFIEDYLDDESKLLMQNTYMSEEERENFLSSFLNEDDEVSCIGFTVLGGIFSEGIDLTHESLIGAIIVGTGLPMIGQERNLLRDFFDSQGKDGYSYAYVFPGMNKVMQAAGRVIRTTEDVGLITLLDDRFMSNEYRRLFPKEWEKNINVDKNSYRIALDKFWRGKE